MEEPGDKATIKTGGGKEKWPPRPLPPPRIICPDRNFIL